MSLLTPSLGLEPDDTELEESELDSIELEIDADDSENEQAVKLPAAISTAAIQSGWCGVGMVRYVVGRIDGSALNGAGRVATGYPPQPGT